MQVHLISFSLLDFIVQNFLAVDVRVERFDQQLKASSSVLFVSARNICKLEFLNIANVCAFIISCVGIDSLAEPEALLMVTNSAGKYTCH